MKNLGSLLLGLMLLTTLLTACAAAERAHLNFKNAMQWQVGRSADDPYVNYNRYSENRGPSQTISNGNIEREYRFGPGCQVFFEIDKLTRKIIGWRYIGSEKNCQIAP